MLNQRAPLDLLFQALADPTRRAMVERLSRGPASVSELAQPLPMSLPAVEFMPTGNGTRLIFTEQGAFLDGDDTAAQREQGTRDLLDALGAALRREVANA